MTDENTLFNRIGQDDGIAGVVDRLSDKVRTDHELAPIFADTPADRLRAMEWAYVATAVDAPTRRGDRPQMLKWAADGYSVSSGDYARFARRLLETLEESGVSEKDTYDVAVRLAKSAGDVTGEAIFVG
jgi:hemoglobin